jgi:hypothetical protein
MLSHRAIAIFAAAALPFFTAANAEDSAPPAHVAFDAAHLRTGRYTYELRLKGELLGTSIIEIRRQSPDEYLIRMDAPKIEQRWSADLGRAFNPLATTLEMGGASPYRMSLRYSDTEVSGMESKQGSSHPVTAAILRQVVDQRVDWAATMVAQFPRGEGIAFDVYDPGTGFSRLVGTRIATNAIKSVLGTLPAIRLDYTIHKAERVESYSVFATKEEPRVMLREDMPNDLVAVLVWVE